MAASVQLFPLAAFPLVEPRDDLVQQIVAAAATNGLMLIDDDIVVAQKIVSKAENRYCYLNDVQPSPRAQVLAREADKDPRLVECILRESVEVMRVRPVQSSCGTAVNSAFNTISYANNAGRA